MIPQFCVLTDNHVVALAVCNDKEIKDTACTNAYFGDITKEHGTYVVIFEGVKDQKILESELNKIYDRLALKIIAERISTNSKDNTVGQANLGALEHCSEQLAIYASGDRVKWNEVRSYYRIR